MYLKTKMIIPFMSNSLTVLSSAKKNEIVLIQIQVLLTSATLDPAELRFLIQQCVSYSRVVERCCAAQGERPPRGGSRTGRDSHHSLFREITCT